MRTIIFIALLLILNFNTGCTGETNTVIRDGFEHNDTASMKEAIASNEPISKASKVFNLNYLPVETSTPKHLPSTASIHEKKRLDHNLVLYTKESEGTKVYLGQYVNNEFWEFGVMGEEHQLPESTVTEVQVFDDDLIIVQGLCGANCAIHYLLQHDNDTIEHFYVIEGGVQVADLNADGINELLAYTGTPISEVTIYKKVNGQIKSANVNQTIGVANGVNYDSEKNVFETYIDDELILFQYDKSDDNLLLINSVSNAE